MKLLNYIPTMLTLNMILGILFGFYTNPKINHVFIALSINISVLFLYFIISNKSFNKTYLFNGLSYLLFFIIGTTSISIQNQKNYNNYFGHHLKEENKIVLNVNKELKSNKYYRKYIVEIIQLNNDKTIGLALLNIKKDSTLNNKIKIGDVFYTTVKFKTIKEPLNPYQFNYKKYLEKQQIHHQLTVNQKELLFIKHINSYHTYLIRYRTKINEALIKNGFKDDELSIINALLLGQRQEVSKKLIQDYTNAGAIHILAVSGLHIGILLLLLNFILKPIEFLKKGKKIKPIIILFLLWFYAFFAGLSPSIIRSVTMFSALVVGDLITRKTNTIHSLFISMFLLLLYNPLYIFSIGFQLSYSAVFSILYFYPLLKSYYFPKNKIIGYFYSLFIISFAAQLGILPLSLYYFHQFPSLFFISSLVIIPFLGVVLALGILIIFLALLQLLPQTLAHFYILIIYTMNSFVSFIAKQEAFLIKNIVFSILLLMSTYIIIYTIYHLLKKPSGKKLTYLLISISIFQATLLFEKYKVQSTHEFIILNQNKNSILLNRNGNNLNIYHNLDSSQIKTNYAINNYKFHFRDLIIQQKHLSNIITINHKTILVIDSLGIYQVPKLNIDYVLLIQSPKININRLITMFKPKIIITDGSNYKSFKQRWKKTCYKTNTKFHNTSINGAFKEDY